MGNPKAETPTNNEREKKLQAKIKESCAILKEMETSNTLPFANLVKLKNYWSDVNNMITYKVTCAFIDWLKQKEIITDSDYKSAVAVLETTNSNTNGFDVKIPNEQGKAKLIAEVKCNIPVNAEKNQFGAAQKSSIKKDLEYLETPSTKTKGGVGTDEHPLKFMVLMDYTEGAVSARDAFENWNAAAKGQCVVAVDTAGAQAGDFSDKSKIYVVFISPS